MCEKQMYRPMRMTLEDAQLVETILADGPVNFVLDVGAEEIGVLLVPSWTAECMTKRGSFGSLDEDAVWLVVQDGGVLLLPVKRGYLHDVHVKVSCRVREETARALACFVAVVLGRYGPEWLDTRSGIELDPCAHAKWHVSDEGDVFCIGEKIGAGR